MLLDSKQEIYLKHNTHNVVVYTRRRDLDQCSFVFKKDDDDMSADTLISFN